MRDSRVYLIEIEVFQQKIMEKKRLGCPKSCRGYWVPAFFLPNEDFDMHAMFVGVHAFLSWLAVLSVRSFRIHVMFVFSRSM